MAKTVKRREWTKDDVRELKSLARQKTPVAKIAKSLKRTPGATQQKAFTPLEASAASARPTTTASGTR